MYRDWDPFLFCDMFSIKFVACVCLLHVCLVKTMLWLRIKHVRSAVFNTCR